MSENIWDGQFEIHRAANGGVILLKGGSVEYEFRFRTALAFSSIFDCMAYLDEEYDKTQQSESPTPDDDGWIEWNGGYCPVPDGTRVDVRYRNGEMGFAKTASSGPLPGSYADKCFWHNSGCDYDIVAYRIAEKDNA